MKSAFLLAICVLAVASLVCAQPPRRPKPPPQDNDRWAAEHVVLALTAVPYLVDLSWQLPLGSRVSWATTSAPNPKGPQAKTQVFLLRGTGTIFSPGFGELCTKLRQAGAYAEDLGCAGDGWVKRRLIDEHRAGRLVGPIVLVGHSRGGRHILDAAKELEKEGIPVDLLVCLDVAGPSPVPGNVKRAVNMYLGQHRVYPAELLKPAPGSTAVIENIDLNSPTSPVWEKGLHHLNITASPGVQAYVLECVQKVPK